MDGRIMELNTKDKTQIVNIPELNINDLMDIYYEEPDNFEKSIHKDVYSKAFHITEGIINSTRANLSRDGKNQGTKIRNREQICNIVFFTGDKGTGKTSTMLSYMEFLKDYHRNYNKGKLEQLKLKQGDFMFTGIEHIDASALNDKEDILGSVLSKMLCKWKNEEERSNYDSGIVRGIDYDHKRRELRLKFSEIYDCLKDLRSTKDFMERDTDMFMEAIERLSLSWNVKQSFQKLVERYLDIMVYPGSEKSISKDNHYLVISIDDLDMNVNFSFMLLEQIRKYLMVPNVLVLMSANYEQLEKNCHNHYLKEFQYMKNIGSNNDEYREYTFKLSREYLEKMIPEQRQVKLTSGKRWEYFSESELKMECKEADKNLEKSIDKPGTICEIVSRYMKYCFGVKFDSNGRCIKYIAPQTIRETCGWISQINSLMENSRENDKLVEEKYRKNTKEYWEDEFQRLCRIHLDNSWKELFTRIDDLELDEQTRIIIQETEQKEKHSLIEYLIKFDDNNDKQQRILSFFIIYYNMKIAFEVQKIKACTNSEAKSKESILKMLIDFYCTNGWGLWGNVEKEMGPCLYVAMEDRKKTRTKITKTRIARTRIARTKFKKDNECLNIELEGTITAESSVKDIEKYLTTNKEKIKNYQYLLLFYRLKEQSNEDVIWSCFLENNIALKEGVEGDFSLSGFVLNLMEGAPLNSKFTDMFLESAIVRKIRNSKNWEEICGDILIFKKYDVELKRYVDKENVFEENLIPMDNIEFMIELGKKLLSMGRYEVTEELTDEVLKRYISNYFNVIIKCLEDYDVRNDSNFSKRFKEFELVQKITIQDSSFFDILITSIKRNMDLIPIEENDWNGSDF